MSILKKHVRCRTSVIGRYVRNILDKIAIEQSQRVSTDKTADKDLITITDVKNVLNQIETIQPEKRTIGFGGAV